MDSSQVKAAQKIVRILLAFLAAPSAAVGTVALLGFISWPFVTATDTPWESAVVFAVYSTVVIFPVSIVIGFPAFLVFNHFGLVNKRNVLVGGVVLSLVYPTIVYISNSSSPSLATFFYGFLCGLCGFVAAWVFCLTAGIKNAHS